MINNNKPFQKDSKISDLWGMDGSTLENSGTRLGPSLLEQDSSRIFKTIETMGDRLTLNKTLDELWEDLRGQQEEQTEIQNQFKKSKAAIQIHYTRQTDKIRNFVEKLIECTKIESETYISNFYKSYKENLKELENVICNITHLRNSTEEYLLGKIACSPQKLMSQLIKINSTKSGFFEKKILLKKFEEPSYIHLDYVNDLIQQKSEDADSEFDFLKNGAIKIENVIKSFFGKSENYNFIPFKDKGGECISDINSAMQDTNVIQGNITPQQVQKTPNRNKQSGRKNDCLTIITTNLDNNKNENQNKNLANKKPDSLGSSNTNNQGVANAKNFYQHPKSYNKLIASIHVANQKQIDDYSKAQAPSPLFNNDDNISPVKNNLDNGDIRMLSLRAPNDLEDSQATYDLDGNSVNTQYMKKHQNFYEPISPTPSNPNSGGKTTRRNLNQLCQQPKSNYLQKMKKKEFDKTDDQTLDYFNDNKKEVPHKDIKSANLTNNCAENIGSSDIDFYVNNGDETFRSTLENPTNHQVNQIQQQKQIQQENINTCERGSDRQSNLNNSNTPNNTKSNNILTLIKQQNTAITTNQITTSNQITTKACLNFKNTFPTNLYNNSKNKNIVNNGGATSNGGGNNNCQYEGNNAVSSTNYQGNRHIYSTTNKLPDKRGHSTKQNKSVTKKNINQRNHQFLQQNFIATNTNNNNCDNEIDMLNNNNNNTQNKDGSNQNHNDMNKPYFVKNLNDFLRRTSPKKCSNKVQQEKQPEPKNQNNKKQRNSNPQHQKTKFKTQNPQIHDLSIIDQ